MRDVLRRKQKQQPMTLENIALDSIILTYDERIIKNIFKLPYSMLEKLDNRCLEIEHTKAYKERFPKK